MKMSLGVANKPEPDLIDLLNIKLFTSQKKKKSCNATSDQRIALLEFIQENPEMITHSSTKENEASLWNELARKLNALSPEKSVISWQKFWKRWILKVYTKNDLSMTKVDYMLKKFLTNINYSNLAAVNCSNLPSLKKKITYNEVCDSIQKLEEEKTKLKLDLDRMEYSVSVYYKQISEVKKIIQNKKKQLTQLSVKKSILNKRKNILDKDN